MRFIVFTDGCAEYNTKTFDGACKEFLSDIINDRASALVIQDPQIGHVVDQLPEEERSKYGFWGEGEREGAKIVAVFGQPPFKMTDEKAIWDSSVNRQQYIRCIDGSWKPLENTAMKFYTVHKKSKSDGFDTFILEERKMPIADVEDGENSNSTQPPTKKASGGTR